MKAEELFTLPEEFLFCSIFLAEDAPWHWVRKIKNAFESSVFVPNQTDLKDLSTGVVIEGPVFLDPSAKLGPNVVIQGPAYIGPGTEIRPGAFIRGNVIVGLSLIHI